jgi:DNA-binding LacI/PurR family transcriptional regulator
LLNERDNFKTNCRNIRNIYNYCFKSFKNYPDVSASTKKAVVELAEKLNYTPNTFAVNLRTRESKTIGLIIPEVVHHFFECN